LTAAKGIFDFLYLSSEYNTDTERTASGVVGGNSTDRAIREFFLSAEAQKNPPKIKEKTPFSSELKYSSVTFGDGVTLIKGAAELILSRCRYALGEDGMPYVSNLASVQAQYREALSQGERVLAVAIDKGEGEMIFVGLLVLRDKLRPGVKRAVADILSARIQIVMVTGDNLDTAVSIASECGFFNKGTGHIALDGGELRSMSDEELKQIIPSLRVVARALPRDKSRLVRLSQELDLVVGMTGDGINDAPSLKLADVGFAMGSGSDIAKGAGDIVILDDSISAIAKTVLYGRTIFKSIRKFICFQLIMNLAACGITLIGPFIGIDTPITIIQMLWVNIIMDTLGGMAFAGEPPLDYYMKEKPKRREEPILSRETIAHIISNGVFTLALLVMFLRLDFFAGLFSSSERHLSAFYALFIFAGLFNCFSARCERFFILSNIGKNRAFIFIMLFISAIQLLIIYFGGSIFRSAPLALNELLIVLGLAFSVIIFDLIRRFIKKLS
nr:cation-transporting P-type ATPase [Clostridia bacterium]